MKMDKKGRPRPDGYTMEIEPREAAIVLRLFTSYAEGVSLTKIVTTFNEENVPGSIRSAQGWSPATISRILDNEQYVGRWIWNRTESRRDPKTGRRRRFDKPESEWMIYEDEELRIVPKQLWEAVRERRKAMHRTRPGGNGKRGVLEGAGQPASPLPDPSPRRLHGLRLVRGHHRPGERQERRLLRVPRGGEGRLRTTRPSSGERSPRR